MGTEHSKPRTSSCKSLNYKIINGSILFNNGDKYIGDVNDGQLNGNGIFYYSNGDVYKGDWRCNKKHGFGIQTYARENKKYVGLWQDNLPHGDGTLYYPDGSYFAGPFLEGEKHGRGIFHDTQNDCYEEDWENGELIARSPLSPLKKQSIGGFSNFFGEKKELRRGTSLQISNKGEEGAEKSITRSERSELNDRKFESEEDYSSKDRKKNSSSHEHYVDRQFQSNILFKSQNEFDSCDVKTYDLGVETLNIIEHMEMLNSVAGTLLNKDVDDWTYKDISDWLRHLGLCDYIEIFEKNHINGEVLFELTEADLKDEFNMTSVGHRKQFFKAVENLKMIFRNEAGKSTEYIRHKIQKFYERNRPSYGLNGLKARERGYYSLRGKNTYHSQHEIIIEDDEHNFKNESHPSPPMMARKGALEVKDELKLGDTKIGTPGRKKSNWGTDADCQVDGLEEDGEGSKQTELPAKPNICKKTLSKVSSDSQKSSPTKEEANLRKLEFPEPIEECKSPKNDNKESSEGSSSESSTESEPSEDDKVKNDEKKEEQKLLDKPMKVYSKAQSKIEKKVVKKTSLAPLNFKSAEFPVIVRRKSSKQGFGEEKKRRTHRNDKTSLSEKIKDEILRIFKDYGLNDNFIIDYKELSFDTKIGEGGYGRVFLGKFSGIDVAIKEYGKTKLDIKRAEDFVKEIEVISNLRHPNIVLCMGACIHNGKYLMITEYLEEGSLFDHLHKKHTKMSDETMFEIIEDIALGMCYLHGRKVFHCDLKSSNILIDSSWSVKLCDFGLSRVKYKSDRKRFQKQRVGTPHWMAPEILRGEKYDEAADVYSFGMILWELVTGEIPYHNMPISEIIATVGYNRKPINLPTKGNPLIVSIMKSCLSLEKEERPTFKQIVDQLQQRNKSTPSGVKKNKGFNH